jgi:probable F420-dependent oxidoreductase
MSSRPFRFGVVASQATSGASWSETARRIERLGFDTMVVPDGLNYTYSPFPALAMAAAVTTTLRIGTYVVANDYRHPVMLAKEAGTVDALSNGRFELGIGAGRPSAAQDNAMLGRSFDSGKVRVDRLAESLSILKPLLAGETVNMDGDHYSVVDAKISPLPAQHPMSIMIAASQRRLLSLAASVADNIALGVGPDSNEEKVAERVRWIREAAGKRFDEIELNLNLMSVGGRLPRYLQMSLGDAAARLAQSDAIPVLHGTIDQMCDRLRWLRDRLGISYIMVGEELMDEFVPVMSHLRG